MACASRDDDVWPVAPGVLGLQLGTLTAVPLVKQQSNVDGLPAQVVVTTGSLTILTLANVKSAPPSGLKWIQVLSVDKVLDYPCSWAP